MYKSYLLYQSDIRWHACDDKSFTSWMQTDVCASVRYTAPAEGHHWQRPIVQLTCIAHRHNGSSSKHTHTHTGTDHRASKLSHIEVWAARNNMQLNSAKTKEIFHIHISITQLRAALVVVINDQLTATDHLSYILTACTSLLYTFRVLCCHGAVIEVLAKITYCLPCVVWFVSGLYASFFIVLLLCFLLSLLLNNSPMY